MKKLCNNKRANFEYHFIEKYIAGIKLLGSEIKSIRENNPNIAQAHCYFKDNELYIKGMYISEYKESGTHQNHDPLRERKLLLNKRELKKLLKGVTTKGITIIPITLLLSKNGLVKLEIALAQGKKLFDKKLTIKQRDIDRDNNREINNF